LLRKQTTSAFSTGSIKGDYTFYLVGADNSGSAFRFIVAGVMSLDGAGNICNNGGAFQCEYDFDDAAGGSGNSGNGGINASTYSVVSSTTGRGTATISTSHGTSDMVFYVVSSTELLLMQADPGGATPQIEIGQVLQQTSSSFNNASLNSSMVYAALSIHSGGTPVPDVQAGLLTIPGSGTFNLSLDDNDGGTLTSGVTITGDYDVQSNGRMTLSGVQGCPGGCSPPYPVFYLVGQNQGYLLGQDDSAQFATLTPQSGSSFTNSSLSGTYLGGTREPVVDNESVSLDSVTINNSNGTVSGTEDKENTGGPSSGSISGYYCTATSGVTCTNNSTGRVIVCSSSFVGNACPAGDLEVILYLVSGSQFAAMDANGNNPKVTDFHQ